MISKPLQRSNIVGGLKDEERMMEGERRWISGFGVDVCLGFLVCVRGDVAAPGGGLLSVGGRAP